RFPTSSESKVHFDLIAYQLALLPQEEITVSFKARSPLASFRIQVDFDLKSQGEEKSYIVRETLRNYGRVIVRPAAQWRDYTVKVRVPKFSADRFSIAPILRLEQPAPKAAKLELRDVQLTVNATAARREILRRIRSYLERQEAFGWALPFEPSWMSKNFVMGFVFLWDRTFFDGERGFFRVDEYCETMRREFGGIQSVILWHSYPNLGIDARNQFDMLETLPGGLTGLAQVVSDFHRNGVRVFLTYNPWDLDTRRPKDHDFVELAKVIHASGADGIFLDTWRSAKGSISVFEVERSIREEIEQLGLPVAFSAEILPDLKDLFGPDALTCSWGQEIQPYHFSDLSLIKWLMPQHKQHFIKRMQKDKKRILAHAWLNGQGVQVWENIFGTMNHWNAKDRKTLRRMNAVWQHFAELYDQDNWKPFLPTQNRTVLASQWGHDRCLITHFADTLNSESFVRFPVSDPTALYFDLWNGRLLKPFTQNDNLYVEVPVSDFGCLLQTDAENADLRRLLTNLQKDTAAPLPAHDEYAQELSIKTPVSYDYRLNPNPSLKIDLLAVKGGLREFTCTHLLREGQCYPDADAVDNHDLTIENRDGAQWVVHRRRETLADFAIMPKVVTNRQFELFLQATGYRPRFSENFLYHWRGSSCPPELYDEPVVYVDLQDARAFAEWAGLQLPTEWEWQLAAETLQEKFVINQVFEWNESERFDGFNRFVTLRGGCRDWVMNSSWWYFPGAVYGKRAGGEQPYDAHVKYFIAYPGMDRAATIGFRCVKH
ncbi:MAG: formylglycine-generating enzyme family protein, partial [candidate division KSB1 bacterium]|nr:formylglycine-generating enzyme family protein [candidate division KSB1 bacterium]